MLTNKKEIELHQLIRFKENHPLFPIGEIIKSEKPDFLIKTSDGILGIELTQVLQPNHAVPKAQESFQGQILFKASEIYNLKCPIMAQISVSFNPNKIISKREINTLAEEIVAIVITAINTNHAVHFSIEEKDCTDLQPLPECVDFIYCLRLENTKSFFCPMSGGPVVPIDSNYIQNIISDKSKKRINYNSDCMAIWLILVEEGFAPSSFNELTDDAINHTYISSFSKVIYYKLFDRKSIELKLKPFADNSN